VAEEGVPVAYSALRKGVPVRSRSGRRFGTLESVLDDPKGGILHGIVVATGAGPRFVARDDIERMTTTQVTCSLTDEQAGALRPAPGAGAGRRWRKMPWAAPDV
jgi:hypothetical protein